LVFPRLGVAEMSWGIPYVVYSRVLGTLV